MLKALLAIVCLAFVSCGCQTVPATPPAGSYLPSGSAQADQPPGFISFCARYVDQCTTKATDASQVDLTPANWVVLNAVNLQINRSISPLDDQQHFGRPEYWTIPEDGYGSCHDYALTKRKMLADAGLPLLALRIAIVDTPFNGRHAILTVATDKGDYVLDNLTDDIRPWNQTGYDWILRQSDKTAWQWVSLKRSGLMAFAGNRH